MREPLPPGELPPFVFRACCSHADAVRTHSPSRSVDPQNVSLSRRYRQQLGLPKHAAFHSSGQQRLALVATEPGVVAGLDLRTGQIAWRSVLPAGETVSVLQAQGKSLLSVTVGRTGAFVRLWGMLGGLMWDAHIPGAAEAGAPPPEAIFSGNTVVVSWLTTVQAFHGSTGEILWCDPMRLERAPTPTGRTRASAALPKRARPRQKTPPPPTTHTAAPRGPASALGVARPAAPL